MYLLIRELPLEQFAVFSWSSERRCHREVGELRQSGPELVDALQPRPPEEDLILRGGPQQGAVGLNISPRWFPLSRFQSSSLHRPFQSTNNESLPPQPRADARVSWAPDDGFVSWPVTQQNDPTTVQPSCLSLPATSASQLRHRLHFTPTRQVSGEKSNDSESVTDEVLFKLPFNIGSQLRKWGTAFVCRSSMKSLVSESAISPQDRVRLLSENMLPELHLCTSTLNTERSNSIC